MFDIHKFKVSGIGLYRKAASADDASSIAGFLIRPGATGEAGSKPGAAFIYAFKR